ncbi:hypothetical protein, partial [Anaerovibrio sp.]|uniref:hypothetical protein n=1 Tax=Anaerovibrio sp. TaxID=1872532 RepID=UPI0025B9A5F0
DIRAVSSVDFVGPITAAGKNLLLTAPVVNIVNGGTNNATNITANSMVARNSAGDAVLNVDTSSLAVGKLGAKTAINFKGDVAVDDSIANMTLEAPVTNVGNGTDFARLSAAKVTSTERLNFNKAAVNASNIQAVEEVNFQNAISAEQVLNLQASVVKVGNGVAETSISAPAIVAMGLSDAVKAELTFNKATIDLSDITADGSINFRNAVSAGSNGTGSFNLTAPIVHVGNGTNDTSVTASAISASEDMVVNKAQLNVPTLTANTDSGSINILGNVDAGNNDLLLQANIAVIGDGVEDTLLTARSVKADNDLVIDKASINVINPAIANGGNLTLRHEIVAGDKVGFQAGKAITMQDMSMDKSTDVSFEGKLIDMRDSSINAGKDGKLFFAAYSVKTESPLSYAFQPDNEVIIDNSRLDAGEMTMLGYSIIARNGAEIYADKTLDALAAKKVAMGNLGNLEIVSQATMSTEPQNKLLQQDAIIEVGGRAYHNFRFIPASAYQSDTIMRYLESINVMPWQIGSDNSPLSIVGIPGLSLYRFQYQDGISDAISGLEMYFTVDSHEGEEREEKEMTNE